MRLCRYDAGAGARHGIVENGYVVEPDHAGERHPLDDIRLLAPVLPRKYLAIGLNYADHIAESGMEAPEFPVFFNKQVTCVVGPGDDVHMPGDVRLLGLAVDEGKRLGFEEINSLEAFHGRGSEGVINVISRLPERAAGRRIIKGHVGAARRAVKVPKLLCTGVMQAAQPQAPVIARAGRTSRPP